MTANGWLCSFSLCYDNFFTKTDTRDKTNTAGFRIQRHSSKILKRIPKRGLKKTGIDQKRFPD